MQHAFENGRLPCAGTARDDEYRAFDRAQMALNRIGIIFYFLLALIIFQELFEACGGSAFARCARGQSLR